MFERCRDEVDAIATAALAGPFAIYGFGAGSAEIVQECVARGFFNRLQPEIDFVLLSDDPNLVGQTLCSHGIAVAPIWSFDHIDALNVVSVVILGTTRAQ